MQSVLFIPDICGFTKFVKEVEIRHSKHIVSELLELLIEENGTTFQLAEVEGDALFFHQDITKITAQDVLQLMRRMHNSFHQHLELYKYKRVCNCGACSSAAELELKFILHTGEVEFTDFQGKKKPFGPAVIESHRLLKAEANSYEYLLATQEVYGALGKIEFDKEGEWKPQTSQVDGDELNYLTLELIKPSFESQANSFPQLKGSKIVEVETQIDFDIDTVFQYIADLSKRIDWTVGIEDLRIEGDRINQVDLTHTCVINGKVVEVKTVFADQKDGKRWYIEETNSFPNLEFLITIFQLEKENDFTKVIVSIYSKPKNLIGRIANHFIKKRLEKNLMKSVELIGENLRNS